MSPGEVFKMPIKARVRHFKQDPKGRTAKKRPIYLTDAEADSVHRILVRVAFGNSTSDEDAKVAASIKDQFVSMG